MNTTRTYLAAFLALGACLAPPQAEASDIVATVSYNSTTHEISVSPDPIVVEVGTHTVVWEKDEPSADWQFDNTKFEWEAPFSNKYVSPLYISVTVNNNDEDFHGEIKYTITVRDLAAKQVYELDPRIYNDGPG